MKNRLFIFGILITVFLLFAGCPDGISFERSPAPSNIAAQQFIPDSSIRVTWNAARNASAYRVYIRREGTVTARGPVGSPQIVTNLWNVNGAPTPLPPADINLDRWEAHISLSGNILQSGMYRFGVSAMLPNADIDNTILPSNIVWSAPISVTLP